MTTANLRRRHASLLLLQNRDDLLFGIHPVTTALAV
jgi:hypothetical protein